MTLPVALHRKIVDFFTSLPMIDDRNGRRAFIHSAALDAQLQGQIEFPGSSRQFIELLVPQLVRYGQLKDGRHALEAVLESAKNYVGQDRGEDCNRLLQELRAISSLEEQPSETLKNSTTNLVQPLFEGEFQSFNQSKYDDLEAEVNEAEAERKITTERDYFEQVGGNVYTGPVYIQPESPKPEADLPPKAEKTPVTA